MATCPKCNSKVYKARKQWTISRKPLGGKLVKLTRGVFVCPRGHRFSALLAKEVLRV